MKIAYFCTTFPVLSETFLQREVNALLEQDNVSLSIYSLWGGHQAWGDAAITRISKWKLIALLWQLPYWTIKNSSAVGVLLKALFKRRPPSWLNFGENLLGIGLGVFLASKIQKNKPDLLHATWASMPAATAWTLSQLLDIPFSMGAHAYDIFEDGGDWLLREKASEAQFIQTSTDNAARALQTKLSFAQKKIKLIRRGLNTLLPLKSLRQDPSQFHFISIGRLVEKKGYELQLDIYKAFKEAGIPFKVKIAGTGPLHQKLQARCKALSLENCVEFLGAQTQTEIHELYAWADYMLFTGIIASNGDRDGLPNVIPEAMAAGVIVLASPGAGTQEAIFHKQTGMLATPQDPQLWLAAVKELESTPSLKTALQRNARLWVEEHFNASVNTKRLCKHFQVAANAKSKVQELHP
ncbi:MAG TPA: colanic acid biosynthesis glycosyltransferase WcaL [Opitutae bacterium]|nr:colanic acid biosynthesis glycosyltransferase WcaL [Opitutae bacterium]|tara:strand:- start:1366 stop:2595 length:1230 start_codon:yes stop_codon:yes gene_type:complete